MPLTVANRQEYNPFEVYFILCECIIIAGFTLEFGDEVPEHCDLNHKMVHFHNGVIGCKEDLDNCDGQPVKLVQGDPLMPIARFVDPRSMLEDSLALEGLGDLAPVTTQAFSLENAGLLKSKDDIIAYASSFDIELKKASNISIKNMLETLELEAKEKGLIKEV
jgi:hypothetical protein